MFVLTWVLIWFLITKKNTVHFQLYFSSVIVPPTLVFSRGCEFLVPTLYSTGNLIGPISVRVGTKSCLQYYFSSRGQTGSSLLWFHCSLCYSIHYSMSPDESQGRQSAEITGLMRQLMLARPLPLYDVLRTQHWAGVDSADTEITWTKNNIKWKLIPTLAS